MSFFTQSTDSERETDLVTPLPIKPLLFLTIAALGIFQVFFLESSPPGFYVDEAAASAQILCLSNFHQNCWGDSWPFFTTVWGVARVGPVHQYSGAVWVSLFGGSIESLRTLSVFYGLLTTFALSLLAKYRGGERLQLWTTLAALTLPWALHSSRLAWDPPVAPFYVVLCLLLLEIGVRSTQYRIPLIVGSAVSFLLAALAYPPVLAQMVFLVGFIFVFQRLFFPKSFKTVLLFAALCAVASFAILFMNTDPVHGRVAEVGIFGNDPRNPTANLGLWPRVLQFFQNTGLHFRLNFLLFEGEFNLRHLPKGFGVFPVVALLALIVSFAFAGIMVIRERSVPASVKQLLSNLVLGLLGLTSAFMAASLTWDSLPHGLRTIGGWPFAALIVGSLFSFGARGKILSSLLFLALAIQTTFFYRYYLFHSQSDFAWWFDTDVTEALTSKDRNDFRQFMEKRGYPSPAMLYFEMQYFNDYKNVIRKKH